MIIHKLVIILGLEGELPCTLETFFELFLFFLLKSVIMLAVDVSRSVLEKNAGECGLSGDLFYIC